MVNVAMDNSTCVQFGISAQHGDARFFPAVATFPRAWLGGPAAEPETEWSPLAPLKK